jgi:hypothetical protein
MTPRSSAATTAAPAPTVHAGLDHLQRHLPPHRVLLLGQVDDAEAAFPDLLE